MTENIMSKAQIKESNIKRSYKGGLSRENRMMLKPSNLPNSCERRLKEHDLQRKRPKSFTHSTFGRSETKKYISLQSRTSTTTLTDNSSPVLNHTSEKQEDSVLRFLHTIDNVDQILKIETRLEDLEKKFTILSSVLQERVMGDTADNIDKGKEIVSKITNLETSDDSPSLASENHLKMEVTKSQLEQWDQHRLIKYAKMQYCPPSGTYLRRDFFLRNPFCLLLSETV